MSQRQAGFTLMEMIGVVAVIAVLASMATPLIFDAIRNARVTAFVEDVNTIRTAVANYYKDTGEFPTHIVGGTGDASQLLLTNATNNPVEGWDGPYLEFEPSNPFTSGGEFRIEESSAAGYQFDLNGDGTADTTSVMAVRIAGVSDTEARKISNILDNDSDVTTGNGAWYAAGRVKRFDADPDDTRIVIYLTRD